MTPRAPHTRIRPLRPRAQRTITSQEGTIMSAQPKGVARRLAATLGALALAMLGVTAISAPASAAGPNLDPEETGSLTIHKFESPETDPGLPHNGTEVDTTGLVPLDGVEFTVTAVTDIDLTTNEGWDEAHALSLSVAAGGDLSGHTTAVVGSQVTASGATTFADLPLGVYYVEETDPGTHPIVAAVEPFIVTIPLPTTVDGQSTWLYDVHVYPKNALGETVKTIDDFGAIGLGDTVSFGIDAAIPSFFGTEELTSYRIVDELDPRLGFVGGSAMVTATDSGGADLGLVAGDYTVTEPADATGGTLEIVFTAQGLATLEAAPGGTVHVAFDTTVESIGDGTITNDAQTFINGHEVGSNTVETLWGAVKIFKYDAATQGGLAGAVFEVYTAATGGDPVSVDGATQFTTDADGYVTIPGLKAGTYYLEEVVAPDRYLPTEGRIEVVVTAGSLAEAVLVSVANEKIPDMALPVTGGDGAAAFTTAGLALLLMAVGAGLVAARRRVRG